MFSLVLLMFLSQYKVCWLVCQEDGYNDYRHAKGFSVHHKVTYFKDLPSLKYSPENKLKHPKTMKQFPRKVC